MAELISKGKDFLGLTEEKECKARHYEFGRDPVSGFRNDKGTYKGQPKRRKEEINTSELETDFSK